MSFSFKTARTAESVDEALLPDNVHIPKGMKLSQTRNGDLLEITVSIEGDVPIETLISTIDEFVSHISSVTQTIDRIEALNDRHKDTKRFSR